VTLERSHGKQRSTRKRASDLRLVGAVGEPAGTRAAGGLFAKGNAVGRNRGIKAQLRRNLGRDATNPLVERLAREVRVVENAVLRDLPSTAPSVLLLVQGLATWAVLRQQVTTLALDAGLTTPAGREYLELALKLDQRCERLAITSLDVATSLAEAERKRTPQAWPWLTQGIEPDDAADTTASVEPSATPASAEQSAQADDAPGEAGASQGQPGAAPREHAPKVFGGAR